MTMEDFVVTVHPAGTLNVEPAGVALEESCVTRSEEAGVTVCATAAPAIRKMIPKARRSVA